MRDLNDSARIPAGKIFAPRIAGYLAVTALLALYFAFFGNQDKRATVNDFVAYWSAARQALHRENPYAAGPVLALEQEIGFLQAEPLIMRNPPWALPVIIVFGWFSFSLAQEVWMGCCLTAVLISIKWLWGVYKIDGQPLWAWLIAALFVPITVALAIGQISPLILLGIAGFLHFHKQGKSVWSGAFLFLAALKPHLVFLLWPALLLWSVRKPLRRMTLFTLVCATLCASLVAMALDPRIFIEYARLLTQGGVVRELTPTLGGLVRLLVPHYAWIQMLPMLLALLWFCFHWVRFRDRWQWRDQVPVLLLASLLTTSYGWFFDQVVLLPCVFQVTSWLATARRTILIGIGALYVGMNFLALALILTHRTTFSYVWTVPASCALYAFCSRYRKPSTSTNPESD